MNNKLEYAEFYITNICNLNCPECNRFNNYKFKGQQNWEDYSSDYYEWSKKVDIDKCGILGGEPLLNPSINDWIYGVREYWPNTEIKLVTNGTKMNKVKGLYNAIRDTNTITDICLHSKHDKDEILDAVKQFYGSNSYDMSYDPTSVLSLWKVAYNAVKDESWPECNNIDGFKNLPKPIQDECINVHNLSDTLFIEDIAPINFMDENGVAVKVSECSYFRKSALIHSDSKFTFHNSDPDEAWRVCDFKRCKHFIEGKLYKCGPSALMPEFTKQYPVSLSPEDLKLMHEYTPLLHNSSNETFDVFFNKHLIDSIPQCKFCSVNPEVTRFSATTHKIPIRNLR